MSSPVIWKRRLSIVRGVIVEPEFLGSFSLRWHRPAVDVSEASGIAERDALLVVESHSSCDAFVLVVLEIYADEFSKCVALSSEYACFDSSTDEETEIVGIGPVIRAICLSTASVSSYL